MAVVSFIGSLGLKGAQFNALQSLAGTGLSIDDITKIVNALNPTIATPNVEAAITAIRGLTTSAKYVAAVNLDKKLNPDRLATAITAQHAKYLYNINVTVKDKASGVVSTITRRLESEKFIPYKSDIIEQYVAMWEGEDSEYKRDFISGTVSNITVSP